MAKSDRELELSGEVGLPAWMATAKLGVKWRASWKARREEYAEEVAANSGLSHEELVEVLEDDEQRRDIFTRGLGRVGDVSDAEYRSTLGRLVAAAFEDDAKISEMDYLTAQVVKLEPLHLRVLRAGLGRDPDEVRWFGNDMIYTAPLNTTALTRQLGIEKALVIAALGVLEGAGFIQRTPDDVADFVKDTIAKAQDSAQRRFPRALGTPRPIRRSDRFDVTAWGKRALILCCGLEPPEEPATD